MKSRVCKRRILTKNLRNTVVDKWATPSSFGRIISVHPEWDYDVQFFLWYHRERIDEHHYFYPSDYAQICSSVVFAMAEEFDPIRNALVAFSSFMYSITFRSGSWLHIVQTHYLRAHAYLEFLNNSSSPLDNGELQVAISTALILVAFHVFSPLTLTNSVVVLLRRVSPYLASESSSIILS